MSVVHVEVLVEEPSMGDSVTPSPTALARGRVI